MLFIASGRGALVGAIAFGSLLVTEFLTERHFHDETYYQQHGWPKLLGFAVAALIVWRLGPHNSDDEGAAYLTQAALDNCEGRSILRKADSFFFVPVRHWPWILCGLGVLFFATSSTWSWP